jgi:tetratricopeptide (TPR) repeat protein
MTTVIQRRLEVAFLLAVVGLVWRGAFDGAFQFDDLPTIIQDPTYRSLGSFIEDLPGRIRPVTRLSIMVDRLAFGFQPAGYHVQSMILHAGCGLLLYDILRRAQLGGRTLPVLAALVFLVHPIVCETVVYVSGRASGLSACLVLLALWLYIEATPAAPEGRFKPLAFAASVGCFALALAAKETAAALPLLLLAYDAMARRQSDVPFRTRWALHHAAYWAVLGAAMLVAALAMPRYRELAAVSLSLRSPWENLFVQAKPLVLALALFVWPAGLNIDHDLKPAAPSDPLAWIAAVGLVALLVTALVSRRRMPAVALGMTWFFIAVLPANGPIARLDLLSERNLYLPLAGLAIAAAGLASALIEAVRQHSRSYATGAFALAALIALGAFGTATAGRAKLWSDPFALWSDAVAKSPGSSRAHNNLGYSLEQRGDLEGAIREYRLALKLRPGNEQAWSNLRRAWAAAE